jgi:hypothetical protein
VTNNVIPFPDRRDIEIEPIGEMKLPTDGYPAASEIMVSVASNHQIHIATWVEPDGFVPASIAHLTPEHATQVIKWLAHAIKEVEAQ